MKNDFDELIHEVRIARNLPTPAEARRIRERAGVSTSRFAQTLGIHRSTLSRWERGLSTPRSSARESYAAALASLQSELAR